MSTEVVLHSRAVLATHARSFRWASVFLPADRRDDAAVVYALCRLVDDLADEAEDEDAAREALDQLEAEVAGLAPARGVVRATREVLARREISVEPVLQLIAGVRSDLGAVRFADDRDLLRYAYRVAGTVGWMMCGVLGVTDPRALPFAIDLGVAMQITNICRDVLEDAGRGRVYLPEERLRAAGTSQASLLAGTADRRAVARVVSDLLDLADRYYASADRGMRWIPARSRLAVLVASRVYRAIGLRLRGIGCDPLEGRVWVPASGKVGWTLAALGAFLHLSLAPTARHDAALHFPLRGLPGVHAKP